LRNRDNELARNLIVCYLANAWESEGKEVKPVATIKIGGCPHNKNGTLHKRYLAKGWGNQERRQAGGEG
jgi:hypothetical protein